MMALLWLSGMVAAMAWAFGFANGETQAIVVAAVAVVLIVARVRS